MKDVIENEHEQGNANVEPPCDSWKDWGEDDCDVVNRIVWLAIFSDADKRVSREELRKIAFVSDSCRKYGKQCGIRPVKVVQETLYVCLRWLMVYEVWTRVFGSSKPHNETK
jgi:hypothetical protein